MKGMNEKGILMSDTIRKVMKVKERDSRDTGSDGKERDTNRWIEKQAH